MSPGTQEAETNEFQASLIYIKSSKPASDAVMIISQEKSK
jgi:hypothetical protein